MKMRGEQQLFDPGPANSPHPGDLSYEEWIERPDIVHHSTFTRDWNPRDAEVSHYGTRHAAEDNAVRAYSDLYRVSKGQQPGGRPGGVDPRYFAESETFLGSGWTPEYASHVGEATGPGVIHSRRIEESGITYDTQARRFPSGREDDLRATDAQVNVGTVGFEIASGLREDDGDGDSQYEREAGVSFGEAADYATDPEMMWGVLDKEQPVARVVDNLYEGAPIAYENEVEDQGSTSYVAPSNAVTSWEQDVAASPNRPQHHKEAIAAYTDKAGPRTTPFTGGSPKVANRNVVNQMSRFGQQFRQLSLFDDAEHLTHRDFPKQVPNPLHEMVGSSPMLEIK